MSNKWYREFCPKKDMGGRDTGDTFDTLNTEYRKEDDTTYSIRDKELMTTDDYVIKIISGRKVYSGYGEQLAVWTQQSIEKRVTDLLSSTEDHGEFYLRYSKWVKEQAAVNPMRELWAAECFTLLDQAYDRLHATFKPETTNPKPEAIQTLPAPNKPRLFARKEGA
jgi:hypothetical protein